MAGEELPDGGGVEQGGDPVCWLDRVCPECGLFVEAWQSGGSGPGTPCPRCGADRADS